MDEKREFVKEFELMLATAKAKALSKLSLERELIEEEFKEYRQACKDIGITTNFEEESKCQQ